MPNLKMFIDDQVLAGHRVAVLAALEPLRDAILRHLAVTRSACQLAVIPVLGLPDQPAVNVEIQLLPSAHRSRAVIEALGREMQAILAAATGAEVAFRCMQHDPATYVTLK